jgi:spermidine synthase
VLGVAGLKTTTLLCAAGNIAIGVAALVLARRVPAVRWKVEVQKGAGAGDRIVRLCLGLAFISGATTFALQVGWNRAFAQVHENSAHSFALILALFIGAIGAGGQLSRVLLRRNILWKRVLGNCWMAGGALLFIAPQIFIESTGGLRYVRPEGGMGGLLVPALVVAVPVMLISVCLPLVLQGLAMHSPQGLTVVTGRTLSLNILGSVVGALLAGFVLPQLVGLWGSIILCAMGVAVAGVALSFEGKRTRWGTLAGVILLGSLLMRSEMPRVRVEESRGEKLVEVLEGTHGIVAVIERGGEPVNSRRLKLNNHYVLGGTAATGDERLQGHVPLLISEHPASVAFLGYGTGITAGSVLFHPVTNVLAVELVPEVVELAREHFAETSFAERYPVLVEDARNFLRGTTNRFDLLIGDLVVPWRQGEGALYTLEHFTAARERLTARGLYCCWVPAFQLDRESFEMILRTFVAVFGEAQIWRGDFSPNEPALLLAGGREEMAPAGRERRFVLEDPTNPHLKYESALWMHFVGMVTNGSAGPMNTEDRPRVELQRQRGRSFAGRELAQWEKEVALQTSAGRMNEPQREGWEAGMWMREFTLLIAEGRGADAENAAARIRSLIGDEAARVVLGQ